MPHDDEHQRRRRTTNREPGPKKGREGTSRWLHPIRKSMACIAVGLLAVLGACEPQEGLPEDAEMEGVVAPEISFPDGWAFFADTPPVTSERAMVSTTDAYATEVGLDVLRNGGNAIDAAVAVSFALAVVHPSAGNIGGGGFLVTRDPAGEVTTLDYREKAPLGASRDMYLDEDGNLTDRSVVGHLAAGVPGAVEGLETMHERYGSLPWEDLVQPAIDLAEGFEVREKQHEMFSTFESGLRIYPTTEETFLPGGEVPAVGDTFEQPELAATLTRIRDQGAAGFYTGRTADLLVEEMERGGGLITHEDLEEYEAVWRDPIQFQYHDHQIYSMPPSSSGGATMAAGGLIMEEFSFAQRPWHSTSHVHLMAEAWKRAYIDRNTYLADPAFVDMPLDAMTSPGYADERRDAIVPDRATPSDSVLAGLGPAPEPSPPFESVQTTHFSIVDSAGRAVAITTTLNSGFGNKVTVEGAGFVLNNEMDDFAAKPGTPNLYGLVQGEANAVQPGKRMLSAMSPTVVENPEGELFMVTGTPGGSTIITTTFQTISNVVEFGMNAAQAVAAPRVHHQHLPDQIFVEPQGLPQAVMDSLEAMGHTVVERDSYSGDAQVIVVNEDGTLEAMSDPRRGGTAAGL